MSSMTMSMSLVGEDEKASLMREDAIRFKKRGICFNLRLIFRYEVAT